MVSTVGWADDVTCTRPIPPSHIWWRPTIFFSQPLTRVGLPVVSTIDRLMGLRSARRSCWQRGSFSYNNFWVENERARECKWREMEVVFVRLSSCSLPRAPRGGTCVFLVSVTSCRAEKWFLRGRGCATVSLLNRIGIAERQRSNVSEQAGIILRACPKWRKCIYYTWVYIDVQESSLHAYLDLYRRPPMRCWSSILEAWLLSHLPAQNLSSRQRPARR